LTAGKSSVAKLGRKVCDASAPSAMSGFTRWRRFLICDGGIYFFGGSPQAAVRYLSSAIHTEPV
jgi:hypothetical protein